MSGAGDSPQIRVRVPAELRSRADALATREGKSISELAREALQSRLDSPVERREVNVQLELHKALLAKLIQVDDLRELAHRNIAKSRKVARGTQAQNWLDEWQRLIDGQAIDLVEAFVGTDEHSIDLRQVSPFAGALSDHERLAAIRKGRAHAAR